MVTYAPRSGNTLRNQYRAGLARSKRLNLQTHLHITTVKLAVFVSAPRRGELELRRLDVAHVSVDVRMRGLPCPSTEQLLSRYLHTAGLVFLRHPLHCMGGLTCPTPYSRMSRVSQPCDAQDTCE